MIERRRDQLDHLAYREHLLVAGVEDLPCRGVGAVDREQHRVSQVLGVTVVVKGEAVVGDDDVLTPVEYPPHDRPLARHQLIRPVHVGISKVRGTRVMREHGFLGARDAITLLVLFGLRDRQRVLADGQREARGFVEPGIHPAAIGGHTTDRDELPAASNTELRDAAQTAVHRDNNVVGRVGEQRVEIVGVVRIAVDVHHLWRSFDTFVQTAVHDRDLATPIDEPADDMHSGRAGTADHERAHENDLRQLEI